jgi:hypothetical protein
VSGDVYEAKVLRVYKTKEGWPRAIVRWPKGYSTGIGTVPDDVKAGERVRFRRLEQGFIEFVEKAL